MYLARKHINGKLNYSIRESYKDKDYFKSRNLFDLGTDPARFIVYPGGNSFYIHDDVTNHLCNIGVEANNEELEHLFFPFLRYQTRRVIEGFSREGRKKADREYIHEQVQRTESAQFHLFDQRRMHYLRFGELDQSRIFRAPKKIYKQLLDKSRDEIEQLFFNMEHDLRSTEKKTYVYVIFDVSGHFPGIFSRKFPQALPREQVDECFLEELCRINDDENFWTGFDRINRLQDYLVRYVCWFFDNDFEEIGLMENLFTEWMDQRRTFRPPPHRSSMTIPEALSTMGISKEELLLMNIRTLTRQYRKMAKFHHPDSGGKHESFLKLSHAYSDLLAYIKSKRKGKFYTTHHE